MHNIRGISIPEGSEKNYTREYYRQIGRDMANEMIHFMNFALNEKYGYDFEL